MAKNVTNAALTSAEKIIRVWEANPSFGMGDVTLAGFKEAMAKVTTADTAVEAKRTELTALLNTRDAQIAALKELSSRALSGIRSTFGPDSSQYEQAVGVRKSERKKPGRKPKKPTA